MLGVECGIIVHAMTTAIADFDHACQPKQNTWEYALLVSSLCLLRHKLKVITKVNLISVSQKIYNELTTCTGKMCIP